MMRLSVFKFAIVLSASLVMASCVSLFSPSESSARPGPQSYGFDLTASQGESEIILNRSSNAGILSVYVDGELKQRMAPQDSVKLIVPDGRHTVLVDWVGKDGDGADVSIKGEPLDITVGAERHVYNILLPELVGGSSRLLIGKKVQLVRVSVNALSGREATRDSQGIIGAVIRAGETLIRELPQGARIAVMSISSDDEEAAASAVDELQYQLQKSRLFTIVERKEIDFIRSERNLSHTGEVSEDTEVAIGHMVGAAIVITGSTSGSGTRQSLILKAVDTTTSKLVSMPREPF